jgi:hypothetical protein
MVVLLTQEFGSPLVSASFIGKHKNGARNLVGCAIFGFISRS